jgi:hypothetical protein
VDAHAHAAPRRSLNGNATPESSNPSRRKGDGGRKSAEPASAHRFLLQDQRPADLNKRRTSNIRLACANAFQASRRRYNRCGDGSFSESGEPRAGGGDSGVDRGRATHCHPVPQGSSAQNRKNVGRPQSGIFPEWGRTEGRIDVYLPLSSSSPFPCPSLRGSARIARIYIATTIKVKLGGSTLVEYRMYVFLNRKKKSHAGK